ncbi:hypothetical protein MKP07_03640 [Niabella hibiscisoli]|nr:hypothetical protein [Niabella hibiscisoli]MCH5715340.1 hypothetical protein [Niabella hibiscisoli]
MQQLGFGSINELLMVEEPDPYFIRNNFADYMDFWQWENDEEEQALNGLTIARSIDGDIVAIIDNISTPFLMLPRHAESPLKFPDLSSVLSFYERQYDFVDNLYFDPYFEWEQKNISVGRDMIMNLQIIRQIHEGFLEKYQPDKVLNAATQPKYIMRKIGGWVYFDCLSGSSIRVKYQTSVKERAVEIMNYINGLLEQALTNPTK